MTAVRSASQALQNASYALSQQMYAQNGVAGYGGTSRPEPGEDVVEGDFTEA
jgi:hypothetical protein